MKTRDVLGWGIVATLAGFCLARMRQDARQLAINSGEIHDYSVPSRHCPRCVFQMAKAGEAPHPTECAECGRVAVYWNPYNRVTQCHACGTVEE
jgi:hypothetical protein